MPKHQGLLSVAAAFNITEYKLREIFADFVLSDEKSAIPPKWNEFPRVWKNNPELRSMVEFEISATSASPCVR